MSMPLTLAPRNCKTRPYTPVQVPTFDIEDQFIAYASPDSTYAVTRRLLRGAKKSILIGIYDFTANYIRDLLVDALNRGVRVTLMVDLDKRKGESELWESVVLAGGEAYPAPSCASRKARYFPSCHQKVIVIDDKWTLVQSGNYSPASIPCNEIDGGDRENFSSGNRDMGIAVHSQDLAKFFSDLLSSDIQLEVSTPEGLPMSPETEEPQQALFELSGPNSPPPRLYRSRSYRPRIPLPVTPVISPENYLEIIPPLLANARHSIYVEQQYIRPQQPGIARLLEAIRSAMEANRRLKVRIILAPPLWSGVQAERETLAGLEAYGLTEGRQVRFLNPNFFVHCHNKLLVVDRKHVLISSQNWSDAAVSRNREAGLLVESSQLARYYARLFTLDWETGLRSLDTYQLSPPGETPILASLGDYMEV